MTIKRGFGRKLSVFFLPKVEGGGGGGGGLVLGEGFCSRRCVEARFDCSEKL